MIAGAAAERMRMPTPAFTYTAWGLGIRSELELPELRPATLEIADVLIRRGRVDRPPPTDAWPVLEMAGEERYFAWAGVCKILVTGGHTVTVECAHGFDEAMLTLVLLGQVAAMLLHMRGHLVLHGSAVAIDGRGVIFLGDKGAGKSTTAAAMVAAGATLLTDDVLAVDLVAPVAPVIVPGVPVMKLSPAAVEDFAGRGSVLETRFPGVDKTRIQPAATARGGVAPAVIYLLARGGHRPVERLTGADALRALMRFSFMARYGDLVLGQDRLAHWRQCAALAAAAPVSVLTVPPSLAGLRDATAAIVAAIKT